MSLTQSLVAPSERFGQLPDQAGTAWALAKIVTPADTGRRDLGTFLTERRGVFMTRDRGAVGETSHLHSRINGPTAPQGFSGHNSCTRTGAA